MPSNTGKTPRESFVQKTEVILPSDANNRGTVFGGRVMAWIDIAGAIAAGRHCNRPVVTASMEDLHFLEPIQAGQVAVIRAQPVFAGNTSLEIQVEVDGEDTLTGKVTRCCLAWITFVALDDKGKPTKVRPLTLETDDDHKRWKVAQERRVSRLQRLRQQEAQPSLEGGGTRGASS